MMNETVLTDPAADLLIATAETLPMMADKRLVIVRDSSHLAGRAQRRAMRKVQLRMATASQPTCKNCPTLCAWCLWCAARPTARAAVQAAVQNGRCGHL